MNETRIEVDDDDGNGDDDDNEDDDKNNAERSSQRRHLSSSRSIFSPNRVFAHVCQQQSQTVPTKLLPTLNTSRIEHTCFDLICEFQQHWIRVVLGWDGRYLQGAQGASAVTFNRRLVCYLLATTFCQPPPTM